MIVAVMQHQALRPSRAASVCDSSPCPSTKLRAHSMVIKLGEWMTEKLREGIQTPAGFLRDNPIHEPESSSSKEEEPWARPRLRWEQVGLREEGPRWFQSIPVGRSSLSSCLVQACGHPRLCEDASGDLPHLLMGLGNTACLAPRDWET